MEKTLTPFLKLLTSLLFLLVIVSNGKFSLIMGFMLLLSLFGSGILGFLYSASSFIAALYLLSSGSFQPNFKKDNIFSILSILILYIPIGVTIGNSLRHTTTLIYLTYFLFIIISISTLILCLKKAFKQDV